MIALILAIVVVSALGLVVAAYCAPVACEASDGLCVIAPGHRLEDLLPLKFGRAAPLVFWGLD